MNNQIYDTRQREYTDLYKAYYRHAYSAARQIINHHEECEDIVQESFIRCFQRMDQGVVISGFGSYIETTAKNIAKDHIKGRSAKKRPDEILSSFSLNDDESDSDMDLIDAKRSEIQNAILKESEFYQTPEELMEQKELQEIVAEILSELPDEQQEALSLYYLEDMKCSEIAKLYSVSVDTIKSRVKLGKKKVEKKVLSIEKTKGIRLHGLAPIAIFFILFRRSTDVQAATLPIPPVSEGSFSTVSAQAGIENGVVASARNAAKTGAAVAGKAISGKMAGIITAAVISVSVVVGGGVGVYKHYNDTTDIATVIETTESADVTEEKLDTETIENEAVEETATTEEAVTSEEVDTTEITEEIDSTEMTEDAEVSETTVPAPDSISFEMDVYNKYWNEHRDELLAEGYTEGDGLATMVSWTDVENADGFEVTTVWASEEGGENTHVYEIEKSGNGTYKAVDGVYKDAYDLIAYRTSFEVPYTDNLQFVDPAFGYEFKSVTIKSYRIVNNQKIWSEPVTVRT